MTLFAAAKAIGVRRVVHVSITNPLENSSPEYFAGKAMLERALVESGIPLSILRPAVPFGEGDILIHNIAWLLRKRPVFGVFGDGSDRPQPIHVDDLVALAARRLADRSRRGPRRRRRRDHARGDRRDHGRTAVHERAADRIDAPDRLGPAACGDAQLGLCG
jgi:uncharacterized protein YbjT (DUF2867 family)